MQFFQFSERSATRNGSSISSRNVPAVGVVAFFALLVGPAAAQLPSDDIHFSDPLTIESLVAAVVVRSPRLRAADAAAEAASHRLEFAGALDDPALSYAAAPNASDSNIEFSQRLPWPGTRAARESVADGEAAAARWTVAADRLLLELAAKTAYAEWYFIERAIGIHEDTEALLDQIVVAAETRYAAGRTSRQDVLQAEVERVDLKNQRLRLERQHTATQARLNALMDRTPDAALPSAAPIHAGNVALDEGTLYTEALRGHPEVMRLAADLARAESLEILAEKAFYPNFQLRAGYNSLWEQQDKRLIVGVSINVPLARSKHEAALDSAAAEARRAEGLLAESRAAIRADVARALAEVDESIAMIALHEDELLPLANEYLAAALADYRSGAGAFLNVIAAERRQLAAELALERARADYLRRLADLERWAGVSLDTAGVPEN